MSEYPLRLALAQINPKVGDFKGNLEKIASRAREAAEAQADLVVFPELALCGYPPEDLLLHDDFLAANRQTLEALANATQDLDCGLILGCVDRSPEGIHNAAALIHAGRIVDCYHKNALPNYGVFDEKRYFQPGKAQPLYLFRGVPIGVSVCEDIWDPQGPVPAQARAGAEVLINISASPYHVRKWREREKKLSALAATQQTPLVYLNMVGGQDELVFDGGSLVYGPAGDLLARAPLFEEALLFADLEVGRKQTKLSRPLVMAEGSLTKKQPCPPCQFQPPEEETEEIWQALVLGTRDYVTKNGFSKAAVGLSGGIDSAVVAALAAEALGPEQVTCLFMPSRYTSEASRADATALAQNLGVRFHELSIETLFPRYLDLLEPLFQGTEPGIAEENLQARVRGNLLMAYSNKFGHLVLATGNKSEFSAGYATLYGDMCGAFALLKDVMKTTVYALARLRNRRGPVIPENILTRPPTAELKPDQTDQDTLPPYEVLDAIIQAYVEEAASPEQIVAKGQDPKTVAEVIALVDRSEYKRRQAPPGIKISERAFGRDRRMPITNGFRQDP